jgi:hypothetical protein
MASPHARNMPMLDQLVVDVINMMLVIHIIPYCLIQKAPLPDTHSSLLKRLLERCSLLGSWREKVALICLQW